MSYASALKKRSRTWAASIDRIDGGSPGGENKNPVRQHFCGGTASTAGIQQSSPFDG
jgi:hypothetical protein